MSTFGNDLELFGIDLEQEQEGSGTQVKRIWKFLERIFNISENSGIQFVLIIMLT